MRLFFRSKKFIAITITAIVLMVVLIICSVTGVFSAPQSSFFSSIIKPVQELSANISSSVSDFFDNMQSNEKFKQKISDLEAQIAQKDKKLADYENAIRQNEFYKEFLDIKSNNPDYKFAAAMIVSKDTSDPYHSFTIDAGTLNGVSVYDPVITANGLVGYISDAYTTQSVVMTIFNPSINVSASNNRTRDTGNVSGQADYALKNYTLMNYVSSENTMASGDYVITSGAGGIFPAGIIIGSIDEVRQAENSVSCFATVKPAVNFDNLSDVMVITDFEGKAE